MLIISQLLEKPRKILTLVFQLNNYLQKEPNHLIISIYYKEKNNLLFY
jgi:hypothetical protein